MFQFTHPGGVRRRPRGALGGLRPFQFTHPGGVRLRLRRFVVLASIVSIHAPGRGATLKTTRDVAQDEFQFTHPGGVRHLRGLNLRGTLPCFNSRTREGCDVTEVYKGGKLSVCFNSRTREGCDYERSLCPSGTSCFNSRTREGCDDSVGVRRERRF